MQNDSTLTGELYRLPAANLLVTMLAEKKNE